MMSKDELEEIKKKLNELERKIRRLSSAHFAYINAVLQTLADQGITDKRKFKRLLAGYQKQYTKLIKEVEFLRIMRQFKSKGKE